MTKATTKKTLTKKPQGKKQHPEKTARSEALSPRGLVIVITGNGKGKTTSAFGQALRAAGQGLNVFIMQFMKGRDHGEYKAVRKYLPQITIRRSGLDSFVMRDNPAQIDIELARRGFEAVKKAASSGKYDMLILDEINVAVDFKLIPVEDLIDFIKNKPPALDLVLTGRYAPRALVKLADTVSEVKEIRHHYAAGIKDRAGIEY